MADTTHRHIQQTCTAMYAAPVRLPRCHHLHLPLRLECRSVFATIDIRQARIGIGTVTSPTGDSLTSRHAKRTWLLLHSLHALLITSVHHHGGGNFDVGAQRATTVIRHSRALAQFHPRRRCKFSAPSHRAIIFARHLTSLITGTQRSALNGRQATGCDPLRHRATCIANAGVGGPAGSTKEGQGSTCRRIWCVKTLLPGCHR